MTGVAPFTPLDAHFLAKEIARNGKKPPNGKSPRVEELAPAIGEITLRTQIAGASTLTVTVIDPRWDLLTSGFLDVDSEGLLDEIEVQFPEGSGWYWRLCMVEGGTDLFQPNVTLTFEDRIVGYLRDKWGTKAVAPGTTTRAQFVKQLIDEVGRGDGLQPIKFVCPSLNVLQPVARTNPGATTTTVTPAPSAKTKDRHANKSRGIGHGAAVTAKGAALNAAQIEECNTLLDEANKLRAGELATTALICAAIGESWIGREPGSFTPNSAGYWGVLQGGSGQNGSAPNFPDPHDTAGMARSFLLGGKGFQAGGAIKLAREGSGVQDLSPGAIATMVEASRQPASFYGQYMKEAWAIIAAYGGTAKGTQNVADLNAAIAAAPALRDIGQLTRGSADNPDEDSWDCISRLAQQVNWFAFSNADTFYYMDGPDLVAQTPKAYITRILDVELRWALIDTVTGTRTLDVIPEMSFTVDNTAFVYRSTHVRKGKVRRAARIATPATPSEVRLNLVCELGFVRAGDVVVFQECGPMNGRWIVTDATRNCLSDVHTQLTLAPPTAPTPEPQATDTGSGAVSIPTGTPSGGTSTAPTPIAGDYFNPFSNARKLVPGRIDAGVDFTMTPGDEILCIGDSRVVGINANWYQSQPLLCMQFTSGQNKGECWYIAEYIGNLPRIGSLIRGGERLCTFGGSGATGQQSIEIGWASPTSHIQAQSGGDSERTAGDRFARFLRSVGCPTVTIQSGTSGSTHNPAGAAEPA